MNLFLKRSGLSADQVLFIGDSASDSACAKNSQVDFALASWGAQEKIPSQY